MFLDSLNGSWQVGTPSKTLFDSAYSSSHAIMTDTLLPYPSDSVSFFYLSFNSGMSTTYQLKFYHRYDFETSADGGFIQFYDYNTSNWLNLNDWGMSGIYYQPNSSTYQPNDTIHGIPVLTGTSNGWEEVTIDYYCMAIFQDPNGNNRSPWDQFMLRFGVFADANTTTHEGWMLDNFYFTDFMGVCASIEEIEKSSQLHIYPNPASDHVYFDFLGRWLDHPQLKVYSVDGSLILTHDLPSGSGGQIDLEKFPAGIYSLVISSKEITLRGTIIK